MSSSEEALSEMTSQNPSSDVSNYSSKEPITVDCNELINNSEKVQALLSQDEALNSDYSSHPGSEPESSSQLQLCRSVENIDGRPTASVSSNSDDKQLNSLKNSLKSFSMSERLEDLEKSLEDVRRKKKDKKDHEQLLREIIKELQKKSKIFHPDKTINRGESLDAVEHAQNVQSALNAVITILRTLTENFLEDTDIDFKYEYFADLEINVLASDYEIKLQIGNVLSKISELSEIKRIKIIGQIRKFLSQSQICFTSYSDDKETFMRHMNRAFYHLKKCIAGYKSLNSEYNSLVKECEEEGDENMTSVIKKLAEQSSKESEQLERLESAKKKSHYNFEIFPIKKDMDEYFILPFVYHVNALLMRHMMLGRSSFHWYSLLSNFAFLCMNANHDTDSEHVLLYPDSENFPRCYIEAYKLARSYKNDYQSFECREDTKKKFNKVFKEITEFLKENFRIEAYIEGKSNRAKFAEEFLKLKNEVENYNAEKHRLRKNIMTGKNQDERSGNFYSKSAENSVESEKNQQKFSERKEFKNELQETNEIEQNVYACNNSSSENIHIKSNFDKDNERPLQFD